MARSEAEMEVTGRRNAGVDKKEKKDEEGVNQNKKTGQRWEGMILTFKFCLLIR